MASGFAKFCAVAVPYLALEFAWLSSTARSLYAPQFARVQGREAWGARPLPCGAAAAVVAYALLVWGLSRFALPGDPAALSDREVALSGFSLGLLVYGTYNLTNYVAFDGWYLSTVLVDTSWGALAMAASAAIARRALEVFGP